MDAKRVPDLEWPKDLFRSFVNGDVIDDVDNPFLEEADFVTSAEAAARRQPDRQTSMRA